MKYEKYRGLILTPKGREVAVRIRNRHETLSRFFSLLGVDAATQRRDIEGIEHHLSPATVEVLADLAGFFEDNPEQLRGFEQSRKARRKAWKLRARELFAHSSPPGSFNPPLKGISKRSTTE